MTWLEWVLAILGVSGVAGMCFIVRVAWMNERLLDEPCRLRLASARQRGGLAAPERGAKEGAI